MVEDDKQFLDFLWKNCEYLTGRISLQEFSSYLNKNVNNITGHFSQSYRINQLTYSIWTTSDPFQIPEVVSELGHLIHKILSDSTSSNVFKLYAKTAWLEVEGIEIGGGFTRDVMGNEMRVQIGLSSNFDEIVEEYKGRLKKWLSERTNAISQAEQLNHRGLIASLKFISALVTYHQITSSYSLALLRRVPIEQFFEVQFKEDIATSTDVSINLINEAIEIYRQMDNSEGELRGKLLVADFLEFDGKVAEAQEIAKEVLPQAEAFGYIRQIDHAKEHIAGTGLKAKMDLSFKDKNKSFEEEVLDNANMSDEKVQFLAAQMIRICELPHERYPMMEAEYYSIRRVAQERLYWCGYIDLLQDKRHKFSKETLYKINPNRVCVCNLYKYKSSIENPEWEIIISAFKKTYCESCPSRSPISK